MIGCLRCFVSFVVAAVDTFLLEEFEGGIEVVLQKAPLVGVEVVDEGDELWVVESIVAEEVADIGPVFLFDMGVIVFTVGT